MLTYANIAPQDVSAFEDYILPYVRELEQRDSFWYFVALEEKTVAGMAVVDPTRERATLLSLGVSPDYQRQGVATELLLQVTTMLQGAGIPRLSVTCTGDDDQLAIMDSLLTRIGLPSVGTATGFYRTTLGESNQGDAVAKAEKSAKPKGISLLSNATEVEKRTISRLLSQQGLLADLDWSLFEEKISVIHRNSEGKIDAFFAMEYHSTGELHNGYTYVAPTATPSFLLIYLFVESLRQAKKYYPLDTPVTFACINPKSDRLLRGLVPNLTQQLTQVEYEGDVADIRDRNRVAGYDNPNDFQPNSITMDTMQCLHCAHATHQVGSCAIYERKPGEVFYGGPCEDFVTAT